MIKRITFVQKDSALTSEQLEARLMDTLTRRVQNTPAALRPVRVAACITLQSECDSQHAGMSMEWFDDVDALRRNQAWQPDVDSAVITREEILRGADWLEQRWRTRDDKLKHMALARRAPGLTAAEFSERWRNRPGRIGGSAQAPSVAIPEAAKGKAYCQNHPIADSLETAPAYDAINEVYFDRLEDMRARIAFFRDHPVAQLDADLVSEPKFVIVRERVVV